MTGAGHTLCFLSVVRIFPKTKPRATPAAGLASLLASALQGFVNSDPPGLAGLTAVKGRPLSTYTHRARVLLRAGPLGECWVQGREGRPFRLELRDGLGAVAPERRSPQATHGSGGHQEPGAARAKALGQREMSCKSPVMAGALSL